MFEDFLTFITEINLYILLVGILVTVNLLFSRIRLDFYTDPPELCLDLIHKGSLHHKCNAYGVQMD